LVSDVFDAPHRIDVHEVGGECVGSATRAAWLYSWQFVTSRPVTFLVKMPEVAVAAKVAGDTGASGKVGPPNPRLCREPPDIVCGQFLSSQLDVWSFSGSQLPALRDHEQETIWVGLIAALMLRMGNRVPGVARSNRAVGDGSVS
jgi:hypothetical protein